MMHRFVVAGAALILAAGAESADTLELFDSSGAAMKVETAAVDGCKMVFDSDGNAFEFCRLERIELRPQASTRIRPGQTSAPDRANVIYAKHQPDPIANR